MRNTRAVATMTQAVSPELMGDVGATAVCRTGVDGGAAGVTTGMFVVVVTAAVALALLAMGIETALESGDAASTRPIAKHNEISVFFAFM